MLTRGLLLIYRHAASNPEQQPIGEFAFPKLSRSPRAVSEAPLRGSMNENGVCGRFRYSDLKEAPSVVSTK